jgi:hypothetical protein
METNFVFTCGDSQIDLSDRAEFLTAKKSTYDDMELTTVSYQPGERGKPRHPSVAGIRGWCFTKDGLAMTGFKYADEVILDELPPTFEHGGRTFDLREASLYPLCEGTIVRMMKIDGKVVRAGMRVGCIKKSHFGGRINNFETLFIKHLESTFSMSIDELEAKLFPTDKKYSAFAYFFVINAMELRMASRETEKGLCFVGAYKQLGDDVEMADVRIKPSSDEVDWEDRSAGAGFVYRKMSFDDAAKRFAQGDCDVASEWVAEAVLAKFEDVTLRVVPRGLIKRLSIVNNGDNIGKRVSELLVESYCNHKDSRQYYDQYLEIQRPDEWNSIFRHSFQNNTGDLVPLFEELDHQETRSSKMLPPITRERGNLPGDVESQVLRFYHLLVMYAYCVPPCNRNKVLAIGIKYLRKRAALIAALQKNYRAVLDLQPRTLENGNADSRDVKCVETLKRIVRTAMSAGNDAGVRRQIMAKVCWEYGNLYGILEHFDVERLGVARGASGSA